MFVAGRYPEIPAGACSSNYLYCVPIPAHRRNRAPPGIRTGCVRAAARIRLRSNDPRAAGIRILRSGGLGPHRSHQDLGSDVAVATIARRRAHVATVDPNQPFPGARSERQPSAVTPQT